MVSILLDYIRSVHNSQNVSNHTLACNYVDIARNCIVILRLDCYFGWKFHFCHNNNQRESSLTAPIRHPKLRLRVSG